MRRLACSLVVLFLGLAMAEESIGLWTSAPWEKDRSGNVSLTSDDESMPDLKRYNLSGQEPGEVILGKENISFDKYRSCIRYCELWLRSDSNWSRYLQVPQETGLELVAYVPSDGLAHLYWIDYANGSIFHRAYDLLAGYYNATLKAEQTGRIMLVLVLESQPSNAALIDVLPRDGSSGGIKDMNERLPAIAKVTITSERIQGYDVYLDGVIYRSDIGDGYLDGQVSFTVTGDSIHTIAISRRASLGIPAYRREYIRSFKSGLAYYLRI